MIIEPNTICLSRTSYIDGKINKDTSLYFICLIQRSHKAGYNKNIINNVAAGFADVGEVFDVVFKL